MAKKELSYDKAHAELKLILSQIQNESAGIDDLAEKIKRARQLVDFCKERLRSIESAIEGVMEA